MVLLYEIQIRNDQGEWQSLRPPFPEGMPPYRYDCKLDAMAALRILRTDLRPRDKQILEVR